MKIVYIAHPIGGNVKENCARVAQILQHVFHTFAGVYPVAPYLHACLFLDDDIPADREFAIEYNSRFLRSHLIHELWVCGDQSPGVKEEIRLCAELGINIIFKDFSGI